MLPFGCDRWKSFPGLLGNIAMFQNIVNRCNVARALKADDDD
jgi:hypothetical protein